MSIFKENINMLWGSVIVEELLRNEIDYFCLSPGSRSTPLAVGVARNARARSTVIYDERAAAFHALGYARATGKPAVLICTSGTAAANYFPAIVEASLDFIPMVVLTADRPPEKIATGANQTIRQSHLFGDYARWFFDLPCPSIDIPLQMVLTTIDQAVYRSVSQPAGPVHLNCQFREPLVPLKKDIPAAYLWGVNSWGRESKPFTRYMGPTRMVKKQSQMELQEIIQNTKRGLVVLGRLRWEDEKLAVRHFSRRLGWPIFADILSGHRLGNPMDQLLPYFDLMLLAEQLYPYYQPDTVLHLGDQPASKRYLQFIEKYCPRHYISLLSHPFRSDPAHRVGWRLESDIKEFCETFSPPAARHIDRDWVNFLKHCSDTIYQLIKAKLENENKLTEPGVARLISRTIPTGHSLFLASSLPVREMDMFADSTRNKVSVSANRGVSGIDGTIASAVGYGQGKNQPLTLLIGDLAFLHDLNSLSLISLLKIPITIVLINNHGGGIFSFLPIAEYKKVFEPYFGTPHQFSFQNAAQQFGFTYYLPQDMKAFREVYLKSVQSKGAHLIEIQTDRNENVQFHFQLYEAIRFALQK